MNAENSASQTEKLVREYEALVHSVESQSCNHGPDGTKRTGVDYQQCCGVSYEYINDLSCRTALHSLIARLSPQDAASLVEKLRPLDARLRTLLQDDRFLLDPNMTFSFPQNIYWWYYGLPRGIVR